MPEESTNRSRSGKSNAENSERFRNNPHDRRHGTANGYGNLKCRCSRCRGAWAEYNNIYFSKKRRDQEYALRHGTQDMRTVAVEIPANVLWMLANEAEKRGIQVGDILAEVARARTASKRTKDPVIQRVLSGFTDRQIAAEFGMTNSSVAFRRQKAGLPANRRPRDTKPAKKRETA